MKYTLVPLAALLSVFSASAVAQDVSESSSDVAPALEEIVVSEFRPVLATDLNTSITQMGQDTIENAAISNFEELIPLVPNMNWSGEGSRGRYFQLRGIGELEQYEGAPNPSVGFIIDDIDLSGVGGISSLFDIQQAEVLRGPQATRFGASALAGMVYMESMNPTTDLDVNSELTVGSDDTYALGGAVGGALSDTVGARISAYKFTNNGFRDNVYLGRDDTNERDELTVRGKLEWNFAGDWTVKLSGLAADYKNGYDAWAIDNGDKTYSDKPGRDEQKTTGTSLRFDGPIGSAVDFVSITGYAKSDIFFSFDGDWGNNPYWNQVVSENVNAPVSGYIYDFEYLNNRERTSVTQEFRFVSSEDGRIFGDTTDWLFGVYASSLNEDNDINSFGYQDDTVYLYDFPFGESTQSEYESTNISAFGRLSSQLGERWQLSGGLRVERWSAEYKDRFEDYVYDPGNVLRNEFKPEETMWGGDINLSYQVTENARLYGLVSRGYKAGGFNPSLARAGIAGSEEAIPYDPEYILNYELGVKGRWAGGRVLADVVVFRMDRDDMQIRNSAQLDPNNPNTFIFVTSNGEGYSYGLEASAAWQVFEPWKLYGSLGVLESSVDKYKYDDPANSIQGREFAHAPNYNANLGTELLFSRGWFGRVDLNAVDSFYFDYSHNEKSKAYYTLNAKVGKSWGNFSAYLWGRNLTDENYQTRGFFFGNEPPDFPSTLYTKFGDPRTYGVTLNYRIR